MRLFKKPDYGRISDMTPEERRRDRELYRRFVGPKADKFEEMDPKYRGKGPIWSFNFVAFFFYPVWAFYRKLYLVGIAVIVLPIILAILFPALAELSNIGLMVALATTANPLYASIARNRVEKLIKRDLPEDELLERIDTEGGVSIAGGIFGALLIVSMVMLVIIAETHGPQP